MLRKALAFCLCLFLLCPAVPSPAEERETVETFGEISSLIFVHCFILGETRLEFNTSPHFANDADNDMIRKGIRKVINRWCMEGSSLDIERRMVGGKKVTVTGLQIRPGIRMAESYANGLTDRLTSTERDCLQKITKVVNKLKKKYPAGSVRLELAIYDYICDHVEYKTSDSPSEREKLTSACYAFLNGKGNCQAYSDLFYTMTTMAGFESSLLSGEDDGDPHIWNSILIDGELVMVDVTFGDDGTKKVPRPSHYFFNVGLDRLGDHTFYSLVYDLPYLKKTKEKLTYYSNKSNSYGTVVKDLKEALQYFASRGKKGYSGCEVLIKNKHYTSDEVNDFLSRNVTRSKYGYCEWWFQTDHHDGNTVISLCWHYFKGKKMKLK